MKISLADRLRMALLLWVRRINRASIESWSTRTYRRHGPPWTGALDIVRAADHYRMPDVPPALHVARVIPTRLKLGLLYEVPYYFLAGAAFTLYRRSPIAPDVPWNPSVHLQLRSDEGWDEIVDDLEFARLRLQGSNPYLLRLATDGLHWIADYTAAFQGIREPVVCTFEFENGELRPSAIDVGPHTYRPGDPGWKRAKLVANALDARYTVFAQHLLRTHFVVGQVYALAATLLPASHPLRAFMDVHTCGTLRVNHFAWKLLLTPTSYFIQSHFVNGGSAVRILQNAIESFRFDDLILEHDAQARGIDRFPRHPYLEDARPAWAAMQDYCADVCSAYADDASVRADPALRAWHAKLVDLFPNPTERLRHLETRDDLITLLTCLVFNNVVHEVSGDFSTYMTSRDPYLKQLVNFNDFENDHVGVARLNDVFLFEQGAFSGMFNTAGNNMLATPLEAVVSDQHFLACNRRFREALSVVDSAVSARNQGRRYKFSRMQPRQWELSVSF